MRHIPKLLLLSQTGKSSNRLKRLNASLLNVQRQKALARYSLCCAVLMLAGLLAACGTAVEPEVVVAPTIAEIEPEEIVQEPTAVEVVAEVQATSEPDPTATDEPIPPTETATSVPTPTNTEEPAVISFASEYPVQGPAPKDFVSEPWINTDQPISLADLEGKVVLVEFWTYG